MKSDTGKYIGIIENRLDPLKLGRYQCRVIGLDTPDKTQLPTSDLPWAMVQQPAISSGISGVGFSPNGLVEGTTVVIEFLDKECQQPVIVGTLSGIPQSDFILNNTPADSMRLKTESTDDNPTVNAAVTTSDGSVLTSSDGTPVSAGSGPTSTIPDPLRMYSPAELSPSAACLAFIKSFEKLASTSPTAIVASTGTDPTQILYPYQDSGGIWTIGWGNTFVNNVAVTAATRMTVEQANQVFVSRINNEFVPAVRRNIQAPLTQGMFDALVSFTYNKGIGGAPRSSVFSSINSKQYKEAASQFSLYVSDVTGTVLKGLQRRRSGEVAMFISSGMPNESFEVKPFLQDNTDTTSNTTTAAANRVTAANSQVGFKDPYGKWPAYYDEPDVHRLARHENIEKTIVLAKEKSRKKALRVANSSKTWNQPENPYNTQYPYNKVMQTESGHVQEYDDSPGSERIHTYHKSGTFNEIDANGGQVTRIVGDGYQILDRNGYIYITGNSTVTIDGAKKVFIGNTLDLEVQGATNINIYNNVNMNVSGDMNLNVAGTYSVKAGNIVTESVGNIDQVSAGNTTTQAKGSFGLKSASTMAIQSDGNVTVDGSRIGIAEGNSAPASKSTGLGTPAAVVTPTPKEFATQPIITRQLYVQSQYESPSDGDQSQYSAGLRRKGTVDLTDVGSGTVVETVAPPAAAVTSLKPISAPSAAQITDFQPTFVLSKYFTLADLCKSKNAYISPVDQTIQGANNGGDASVTKQQVVTNLQNLATNCLDVIKAMYPSMLITSGFRRPGDVARSSKTSRHYFGEAADIVIPGFGRQEHYNAIKAIQQAIPYDQLILEYRGANTVWIHVSLKQSGNRNDHFTMRDDSIYPPGSGTKAGYTLITAQ